MRFLHTSDWHLGRIFHGLHLLEDQMAVLGELMSIIREEKIDALFIAGDIYDRSVPPTEEMCIRDRHSVRKKILPHGISCFRSTQFPRP